MTIEVEIKCFGWPNSIPTSPGVQQLNHYYNVPDLSLGYLFNELRPLINDEDEFELSDVLGKGKNFSVRTRYEQDQWILVIKYGQDSENGEIRREFELELDFDPEPLLLKVGASIHSKWARERQTLVGMRVLVRAARLYSDIARSLCLCLDQNTGYGKITELEVLVSSEDDAEEVLAELKRIATEELGLQIITSEQINQMYSFYQSRWKEYYPDVNKDMWSDFYTYTENLYHE